VASATSPSRARGRGRPGPREPRGVASTSTTTALAATEAAMEAAACDHRWSQRRSAKTPGRNTGSGRIITGRHPVATNQPGTTRTRQDLTTAQPTGATRCCFKRAVATRRSLAPIGGGGRTGRERGNGVPVQVSDSRVYTESRGVESGDGCHLLYFRGVTSCWTIVSRCGVVVGMLVVALTSCGVVGLLQ